MKTWNIGNILTIFVIMALITACEKITVPAIDSFDTVQAPFDNFRDIPGVTAEEIAAIEAIQQAVLQKERGPLIFANLYSIEAFFKDNGSGGGYTVLLCEWLSKLFGIPFQMVIYPSDELNEKVLSHEVDFGGNMGANAERLKTFYMTDTIAERQYRVFRIRGSRPLDQIAQERLPRYAFIPTQAAWRAVAAVSEPDSYEILWFNNYAEAYPSLVSGEVDVLIAPINAEANFITNEDIYSDNFYPLIFSPVSMYTANPALNPFITIMTKALRNGAIPYLTYLYEEGHKEYRNYKMSVQLNEAERNYITSHPVVPVVANYDNYPVCFYNTRENEWQGIFFDLLDEITAITGLSFNLINENNADWPVIYEMARSGEASIIAELTRTREREDYFLWPEMGMQPDYFALISKSDYRDMTINDIQNARVGIAQSTVFASTFKLWFPTHTKTIEYENMDGALLALQRGEVDLVMSTQRRLMFVTHFLELPGYKTNIVFDQPIQTISGVNKNEEALCSIIDKALKIIDTKEISERWMRRTYDYRAKVAEAQRPWLYGAIALSLVVLALTLIMFIRGLGTRKRLAKLVAEETSTLTAILNSTPDHIFCKDLDSQYTRYNKSFRDYYKVHESTTGKISMENIGLHKDLAMFHKTTDKKVFSEGKSVIFEVLVPSPDGKGTLFETIKAPLIQDGIVTGLVGMARDITIRKAAEEKAKRASAEAMKAYAEAENASQAKSRFIANMSHEIRTPMNAILGITEIILRNEALPEDVTEALYKIYNSGDLLLYLINDILDLSKIEAGKLEILPAQYEVASMINDTVTLNMMRIGSKPIEFRLEVDENIPAQLIGDEQRIRQILNNILSNAIKYTFRGEVKLTVYADKGNNDSLPSVEGAVALVFSVSDTGQGMTQEQINMLFDEYSRFNADANRTTEGAGLGMSITQNLVSMMRGNICVDSEPDKGTTVTVRLPQVNVGSGALGRELAENLAKFEKSAIKPIKKAQIVFEPMPYGSVLLVDDVDSNLFVAEGLMIPYGLTIESVSSGFAAIEKIKEGKIYDIVFMDHMMPKMDGIEATKKIRELGYTQPVVALTANAIVGQSNIFMENGFDGFISKPIDIRQLNTVLKKFVRDKQPPEVIEAANRDKRSTVQPTGAQAGINPKLAEIFARDATKLANTLEEIQEKGSYSEEDIRTYTISTHALKSALTNVREAELSSIAAMLEQAGREKNMATIASETHVFLDKLRTVIKKHTPHQEDDVSEETIVEDTALLQEKLQVIKNACETYDKKAIKGALTDLQQKEWAGTTRKLLATMEEELLNGDFAALSKTASERNEI